MTNLISKLLKYALYLGLMGQLLDATISMRKTATLARKRGLVSLRSLNDQLIKPR